MTSPIHHRRPSTPAARPPHRAHARAVAATADTATTARAAVLTTALTTVLAAALSVLTGASPAHAAVGPAGTVNPDGSMASIDYGNGGNIFDLLPLLSVQGLGNPGNAKTVSERNPLLQYSFAVSGAGSNLMTVDYQVHNNGLIAADSFAQLRFVVNANPDGDPATFADVLGQTWGAAAIGDPVLREGRAFTANPFDTIGNRFVVNKTLTEGALPLDAACTAAAGCDATVGLQWNAALLGPGETFHLRLGLSDNGQVVAGAGRWIDAASVVSANTTLRISGLSEVTAVPEPSAAWLWMAGLAAMGRLTGRLTGRQRQQG